MKRIRLGKKDIFALVDDEDFESLSKFNWQFDGVYAARYVQKDLIKTKIKMHRVILSPAAGLEIDHIDRNPLNNCRSNLRAITHHQNVLNKSPNKRKKYPYKGIRQMGKRWQARIAIHGKTKSLGWYHTAEDAYNAYKLGSIELHGEYGGRP